jgi:hypothetical protein
MSLRDDIRAATDIPTLRLLYRGTYGDITTAQAEINRLKIVREAATSDIAAQKAIIAALGGNGDLEDMFIRRLGEIKLADIK